MGLDRDDTIIRRRLRQKLEFLVEDAASATPPSDAELQAWLGRAPRVLPRRAAARVPPGVREPRAPRAARRRRCRGAARAAAEGGPRRRDRPPRRPVDAAGRAARSPPCAKSSDRSAATSRRLCWPSSRAVGPGRSSLPTACTSSSCASAWPPPSPRSPRSGRCSSASCSRERRTKELDAPLRAAAREVQVTIEMPKPAPPPAAAAARERRAVRRGLVLALAREPGARGRSARRGPTRPGPASSSCARRARDLVVPLEEADRRRGRDPDRAGDPRGLPARDPGPPAAHAGRDDRARHAHLRGRPRRARRSRSPGSRPRSPTCSCACTTPTAGSRATCCGRRRRR